MNRRKFWTVITGGLMGTRLGWYDLRFPPEKILEIDQHGIVHDLSRIDFEPLIKSFKELEWSFLKTGEGLELIRKEVLSSPVFLDLVEEDDES